MSTAQSAPDTGFSIEHNVVYGLGSIGHGTAQAGQRELLLDVYLPAAPLSGPPRAALLLSHGGAYHRGSKELDEFEQDGSQNTPMMEYCRRFAARGYVCFSIGYRLTQELPAPQALPIKRERSKVTRGRIDYVRGLLGLPVASDDELMNGVEAAIEDVAAAFRFVQDHAGRWNIDPDRIVMGGFSAGAFASLYAAYALGATAAAIVCLSGGMDPQDADYFVHGTRGQPPVLMFASEHDLPGIAERTQAFVGAGTRAGIGLRSYFVPGKPHFYDRETKVVLKSSSLGAAPEACTLEEALISFLDHALQPARVTTAMLESFAQAWTRHDLDTLMSFMSEDCIFHSGSGTEACGTRNIGRAAVRQAFARAWADFPDAKWTRARHFVSGSRGVSEWTFVGTRASDGVRVEVDGCDLFTFEGDKIRVKDSWRKQRV